VGNPYRLMTDSSTLLAEVDRTWRDALTELERECVGAYDDARRPSEGVNVMGELSMDRLLKSHELLETGEVNVLCPL
jgi:hypothetical protein